MNKFIGFVLVNWLFLACMAQSREASLESKTNLVQDREVAFATKKKDTTAPDSSDLKLENVALFDSETKDEDQEQVGVWSVDQVNYLQSVDKILLFNVVTTEIGSRKLELDSELEETKRKDFINTLLDSSNYADTLHANSGKKKRFTPHYQMLLEKEEEKLTLMFDAEGMEMMVANLTNRQRFPIGKGIIQKIKTLKEN